MGSAAWRAAVTRRPVLVAQQTLQKPGGLRPELRGRIAALYRLVFPWAALLTALMWSRPALRRGQDLSIPLAALALALAIRSILLGAAEAVAFPAVHVRYLVASYPLAVLWCFLGLLALARAAVAFGPMPLPLPWGSTIVRAAGAAGRPGEPPRT